VLFPSPATPPTAYPPLPGAVLSLPDIFRTPVESDERVEVGVDEDGSPVSVAVTQTLVLHQKADYRLMISAPVLDVESGPGTESLPGQRKGAIMWQGFAAGRKILSAHARLDAAAAGPHLPLQISFSRGAGRLALRLRNTTPTAVPTFAGNGVPASVAKVLDALRRDPTGRTLGTSAYITVKGTTKPIQITIAAPLLVKGAISTGTASRDFRFVLGGGGPLEETVRVPVGKPRLELTVTPIVPDSLLRPPSGRSWLEAIRLQPRISGRRLLAHALMTGLTLARAHQYDTFLENPDARGPSAASYIYRTAARPTVTPTPAGSSSDGETAAVLIALIAAAMVVAAGGLVVLWAHS